MNGIEVALSPGEAIDRLTILEIKIDRLKDPAKLSIARREHAALAAAIFARPAPTTGRVGRLRAALREANEDLWAIEDDIRGFEARGVFDEAFIALARAVYKTNDRRGALKRAIDREYGAGIHEVKSHDLPDVSDV